MRSRARNRSGCRTWGSISATEVYGLPLEQLREVARVSHLRRVPGAPAGVAGLVNLRGEILCALDVRAILGLPAQASTRIAVHRRAARVRPIRSASSSIRSPTSIRWRPSDIEAPPATWPAERAACFIGTARVSAGLMGLLDLARVTKV